MSACVKLANAGVAELADAPDLGSGVFDVGVQVPSAAPEKDSGLDTILGLFQLNPPFQVG